MIISPKEVIDREFLSSPEKPFDLDAQLQPSGIDVRVSFVKKIDLSSVFIMSPSSFARSSKKAPLPIYWKEEDSLRYYQMRRGYAYDVQCYEWVKLPVGVVAYVFGRSTLNRNGVFARSSLYDPGFNNYVGFTVYPFVDFEVAIGERIAQIVFARAESVSSYDGQYQGRDDKKRGGLFG